MEGGRCKGRHRKRGVEKGADGRGVTRNIKLRVIKVQFYKCKSKLHKALEGREITTKSQRSTVCHAF